MNYNSISAEHHGQGLSILLVTDRSAWGLLAANYLDARSVEVTHFAWQKGVDTEGGSIDWEGDWIIGFKADYVLSASELASARSGAINFHPAPPNFRGVGTYDLAIANGARTYGVTCHHMTGRVDAGPIICAIEFAIPGKFSPDDLRELTAARLYALFVEVLCRIGNGAELPISNAQWSGPLHTWRQYYERAGMSLSDDPQVPR